MYNTLLEAWGERKRKWLMHDYLGWQYGFDDKAGRYIIGHKKQMPNTFCKYYSLSKNSVDALTNLYVYASHPALLNDPFDCDMNLAIIEDDKSAQILLDDVYDYARSIYEDEDFFKFATEAFTTIEFAKLGILSMTESGNNPIMWALYAQNSGFCLEWDVSKFPFAYDGPFPVHYVEQVIPASTSKYSVQELAAIQSNVKNTMWKYENEWRLLIKNPPGIDMKTYGKYSGDINRRFVGLHDRKFRYPIEALKSITLGMKFINFYDELTEIVTSKKYEMHVFYKKNCLQNKILNFLSRIIGYIEIKLMVKEGLGAKTIDIDVIQLRDRTYRIIEK